MSDEILEIDDTDYEFVSNHFECDDGSICHFEVRGEEGEFVRSQPDDHVWSIVEGSGDDSIYIVPGYRVCNLLHYAVSTTPWENEDEEYYWFKDGGEEHD